MVTRIFKLHLTCQTFQNSQVQIHELFYNIVMALEAALILGLSNFRVDKRPDIHFNVFPLQTKKKKKMQTQK